MANTAAKEKSTKAPHVLVVEDDKFLQKMLVMKFGIDGFVTSAASDGEEALRLAFANPPDLVMLDLILPKVNGFEVLAELKTEVKTRDIPVIVLSNLGQDEDIRRARDNGAVEFMVKSNLSIHEVVEKAKAIFLATKKDS